ncbi:MAG: SMC-Scp complex subunit ScpB [Bacteroidota bacterium]|nr:SMC-Scp complex subunit ScpB [Bacteroidota bacterium]
MDPLQLHMEAIIFCSTNPVTELDLQHTLNEVYGAEIALEKIKSLLDHIVQKYADDDLPFGVYKTGGGYRFLTKAAYQASIGIYLKQKSKKRLSTTAMETLTIIAYKQPISKGNVEQIRGVNCDYAVQKLLEKELIEIKGKADTPGKPVLYGTTDKFMDYFGINSISDLPTPKDVIQDQNEIGTAAPNEE